AQAEHDTVLYLLVDASPSMETGTPSKFLAARRLAAALGYIALAHLDGVILVAPGSGGREQTFARAESGALFRALQDLQPRTVTTFDAELSGWSARSGVGHLAIVLSDLLLDGYQDGVRRLLVAGCGVVVLHVLSPQELLPDGISDVDLVDSETGEHLMLHL